MDLDEIAKKLKGSEGSYLIKIKTRKGPIEMEDFVLKTFSALEINNLINHWSPYSKTGLLEIKSKNLNVYIEWYISKNDEVVFFKKIEYYDVSSFDDYLSSMGIENYVLRLMRMEF